MSSDPFPYRFNIVLDHHRKTWSLCYKGTDQLFHLESALDQFRQQSTTGRKATDEFFKSFVKHTVEALTILLTIDFLSFQHSDSGPTFEPKYLSVIQGVQRGVTDSVRESFQHQTGEPISSYLLEKLLESRFRSLFKSTNPESILAACIDEKRLFHLRYLHKYEGLARDSKLFDEFELRLARYTVRRSGLTLRDNGPLIARLRDEIQARFLAFEKSKKLDDRLIGESGHKGDKTQTDRHKGKDGESRSGKIWKHLTISRDETSASDFLREGIVRLFLKHDFSMRENEEFEDSDLRQIEGPKFTQKEPHFHSFLTYPRREPFAEEASSQQLPSRKRSHGIVHIEKMESRIQQSSTTGTEGVAKGSKELYPAYTQQPHAVSRATSMDLEYRPLDGHQEDCVKWKIIHLLQHSVGQPSLAYLDKPAWTPGFGRDNFRLKAFLPVTNLHEYVQQSHLDFTISRFYSEPPLAPELRRVLAKKQPPPDPLHEHEQIELRSQRMVEAMQEFFRFHPDFTKDFPDFDIRAPIPAPYMFWYTSRGTADLQRLSHPNQELMATLTSWITRNYEERYTNAKNHLENGVVTLRTMPFLLRPGDVLVWKGRGNTKAAITSSMMFEISPPILYWDNSQMVGFGNNINGGTKRGEFSTTWRVDVWSYRFNGEFLRDKRCKEIKFKASSLDEEVEVSTLGVYPLNFADEGTRHQLETRGKTFWTCRRPNLVSHKGEEGLFAVCGLLLRGTESQLTAMAQKGERFMVDFQVYKQLHSDSRKFKPLYEEHSDSSDGSEDSDDSDDEDDEENTHKISAEGLASDTPPSDPYIYLFPDTVPGYNLRSKKWGKCFFQCDRRYYGCILRVKQRILRSIS